MTAREMFNELGHRRSTDIDVIKYSKKLDDNGYEAYIITCDLLKAINQQCKELGWL